MGKEVTLAADSGQPPRPKNRKQAKAIRITNLPKSIHRLFCRALELSGGGSQSSWALTKVRQLIREQQQQFGEDLFAALTEEEKDILQIIASGAAELEHIVAESLLSEAKVERLVSDLVDRGFLEIRKKGGGTERSRGAAVKLYFVTAKYTGEVR